MAEVTGPISTLPGAGHSVPDGTMCDMHEDRPAVARIQGETDSFGAELNDMCAECLDEYRREKRAHDSSGRCDWCGKDAERRTDARDYDEGMCGPVYQVCIPCIDRRNAAAIAELEDDDWRYGDDE